MNTKALKPVATEGRNEFYIILLIKKLPCLCLRNIVLDHEPSTMHTAGNGLFKVSFRNHLLS